MRRMNLVMAGLLCGLVTATALADENTNVNVVRQFIDIVWNKGNTAVVDELTSPDFQRIGPTADTSVPNREAFKAYVTKVHNSYPDFHVSIDEISGEADHVTVSWTVTGTFTGSNDIPGTNKKVSIKGTSFNTLKNGKITLDRVSWDTLEWYRQVGVEPRFDDRQNSIQLVRKVINELYNKGNPGAVDQFFSSSFIGHSLSGKADVRGVDVLKQHIAEVRTSFPDLYLTVEDTFYDEGRVVARWTARATHKGDFNGISPTGKSVTVGGLTLYRIANGKIIETWSAWDSASLLHQIGVELPTPSHAQTR